jgi:PAS domain S-box-containing protein
LKGNILIVDDNPDNLSVLEQILTADGCKVRAAVNGEIALRSVGARLPDLILLDIMMPGMDGFEVCRRLKGDPSTAGIPVLFISALSEIGDKLVAFEAGGVDYVTKPFAEQEVLARVRTHLGLAATRKKLLRANRELNREIKARKAAEERYRTIFDQCPEGIMIIDPVSMGFVDFNTIAHSRLGYSRDEFADLTLFDIIEGFSAEEVAGHTGRILEKGYDTFEGRDRTKSGEIRDVLVSARKLVLAGRPLVHCLATDITERKKLEEQLLQAQKMESIGLLAGGVAHDFNNILTAISGYGQILRDNIATDDALLRESITQVLKASERAAELTRGLLAFSRKQIVNPQPVHIDTLIVNTGKLIRRIIGEDIEFRTEFSGKKLFVMADPGQIEQVLMNLATNARDAMPRGGRLSISTKRVMINGGSEALYDLSAPGKYALISVSDSGGGIDKKSMERLFQPFYTTKEVGKGTGLGLSIVYGIIKQHKGAVMVSSEAGLGTTFNIYLPLIDKCAGDEESEMTPAITGGTETILVAEDEFIVGEYLKILLGKAGYRVMVAGDGEEALAMFEAHDDISLVLSDVVMPKKNGVEILMEIKKRKPGIKVIFISGYSAEFIRKMGIIEDGVDYIAKPFEKNHLLRKIREILDSE